MNMQQKKDLAKLLYIKGLVTNQGELANKVGVSEQTISKWKKTGNWDKFKKSLLVTRQEELSRLYDQISALNDKIQGRAEGERYPQKGEADTLVKITSAIRNLETEISLAQVIDVFQKFNDYLRQVDLQKAKELIGVQDAFVKTLM